MVYFLPPHRRVERLKANFNAFAFIFFDAVHDLERMSVNRHGTLVFTKVFSSVSSKPHSWDSACNRVSSTTWTWDKTVTRCSACRNCTRPPKSPRLPHPPLHASTFLILRFKNILERRPRATPNPFSTSNSTNFPRTRSASSGDPISEALMVTGQKLRPPFPPLRLSVRFQNRVPAILRRLAWTLSF